MPPVLVRPTKSVDDQEEEYEVPIDPTAGEAIQAWGFFPQNSGVDDYSVYVTQDLAGNLVLGDSNGEMTLNEIRQRAHPFYVQVFS